MKVSNKELKKINLKIKELAIKESNRQITEKEYKIQLEPLKVRARELIQNHMKGEKEKMYKKKEPEKKTVPTKLSKWW